MSKAPTGARSVSLPGVTPDPTKIEPDEEPRTEALTPAEVEAREREKAALLDALRVPKPAGRSVTVDAQDGKRQRQAPTVTPAAVTVPAAAPEPSPVPDSPALSVDDALKAQAVALAAFDAARANLETANLAVDQAREQAAQGAHAQAAADATRQLQPFVERVTLLRAELDALHARHGATLKVYAQSCASGPDPLTRAKLQAVYGAADPLRLRIVAAVKACQEGLRLAGTATNAGADSLPWAAEVALKACDAALTHDAAALRTAVETLIAEGHIMRGREVRIVLDGPAHPAEFLPAKAQTGWQH